MKSLNGVAVVAAWGALAAGGAVYAQEAVQWRVEDGGNGHWYRWVQQEPAVSMWTDSADSEYAPMFRLVVLNSEAEQAFLISHLDGFPDYTRFWIGYYRVQNTTWVWRVGETSAFTSWGGSNCGAGPYPNYGWSGFLAATLHRRDDCGWNWDDYAPEITPNEWMLLEYSADCNGDGIVDYGQILDGTLEDANGNGVPDCCDEGIDCNPSDCDNNGISDADEIAAGVPDCNQNGIPDNCDYEGLYVTPQQTPFGSGNGLSHTFTDVDLATEDVSLMVEARGDLGSTAEFATLKIDGETIDVLWVVDGQDCPAEARFAEYIIPADDFNAHAKDGEVTVSLEASLLVGAKECPDSFARVTIQYATTFPDCNGNGLDDNCELADGTLADCDGNGVPDTCDDAFPDCNANGIPDSCDIADGTLADCNGNGQPDSCEVASWPDLDCDSDGQLDECQIAGDAALDENEDGILDSCSFALGDFDLDGMVGGSDLAVLLSLWGSKNPPVGDLTGDGMIDGADLANLLGNWGPYQGVWGSIIELLPDPEVVTDPEWRERIIATGLPWRVRDNASQIEMLLVPPGTFMMGCSPSNQFRCDSDENPVHEVTLTQAFYLGRYEVTQAQWTAVMGSNPSYWGFPSDEVPFEQVPFRPVDNVSWNTIQGFEAETGLRLPTEAEWEYACRAGTQTAFNLPPSGTNNDSLLGQLGWFNSNSASQTRPVGQKQANNLGLHDLHGNVWEWVEDWYGGGYYVESPAIDPPGPISGTNRVSRGGNWSDYSVNGRTSNRDGEDPGIGSWFRGFRAARTP